MPSTTNAPGPETDRCHDCSETISTDANFCPNCGAGRDAGRPPAYCSACGAAFSSGDEFCGNCGAPRSDAGGSATGRSARSADSNERAYETFRRRVELHVDAGWELRRDHGDRVELVDRDVGSIPIHVLLLLFTGGLGNLLYGWYHYSVLAETRYLSIDDPDPESAGDPEPVGTAERDESGLTTVASYGLSVVLILAGAWLVSLVVGGATAGGAGTALATGLGLGLMLVGLGIAPPIERRLERRHGLAEFGRLRTVDHRVIRPAERTEEPCVVCGESFRGGLVRRRRDETVLAGVPVRTHSIRHNHYCADCARTELFGDDAAVDVSTDDAGDARRSFDAEPSNPEIGDPTNLETVDDDGRER